MLKGIKDWEEAAKDFEKVLAIDAKYATCFFVFFLYPPHYSCFWPER